MITQRRLKLTVDQSARHSYICDTHKHQIQSLRPRHQNRSGDNDRDSPDDQDNERIDIDFSLIGLKTLHRFKRYHKIQTRPGLTKSQLAELVEQKVRQIKVSEKEVLTYFIYNVNKNRNSGAGNSANSENVS